MPIHWQAVTRTISGLVLALLSFAVALPGCGGDLHPVDRETFERIVAELEGRSFRQFSPSIDGSPRRGVILDSTMD